MSGHREASNFTNTDRRALTAVAVQFFVNGALFASFIPRLPEIRDRVGISVAGVGLLMSIAATTGLASSALVGPAIARFGTRRVMLGSGAVVSLSLPVVGIATNQGVLLVGLVGMLAFDVLVDVAMNMQGSWLSSRRHAPVMNRLHGLWSLGTAIGGFSASRIAAAGVSLSVHLVVAGAVLLAVVGLLSRGLLRVDEHPSAEHQAPPARHSSRFRRLSPTLVLFGLIGLFSVAIESPAIDWAAFRFTDDFGATAGFAALGYVAVTMGMTVGRLGGDWAIVRVGNRSLARASIVLSGLGLLAATVVSNRFVGLAGYGVAGLGIATMLPGLYDAAAKHPGRPGAGLGALTGGIRTASLVVPFLVGSLASTSLSVGSAIAVVTLPSVAGFFAVSIWLARNPGSKAPQEP